MKTWKAKVYVGNIPHNVEVQAESQYAAQQLLESMYGARNLVSVPTATGSDRSGTSSWLRNL